MEDEDYIDEEDFNEDLDPIEDLNPSPYNLQAAEESEQDGEELKYVD